MPASLTIVPGRMTLGDLRQIWMARTPLTIVESAYAGIEASASTIRKIVERGAPAYGINTGFGKLAKTRIPDEQLELLQRNLIVSHSVGTGELLHDDIVRLVMALKIAS